jgi:hypothetical protein
MKLGTEIISYLLVGGGVIFLLLLVAFLKLS